MAASAVAMPAPLEALYRFTKRFGDSYSPFSGDGSAAAGWPTMESWGSWDELWAANSALMPSTCGWNQMGEENTPEEIENIRAAILQVSGETGVDARFILNVVMQESKGCPRAGTTNNGVRNPGLMQSHNGIGDCIGVSPCPNDMIIQMIRDGTAGTADGDGLQQLLPRAQQELGDTSARSYYAAARYYNSGSLDPSNLNNPFTSTLCYCQDVANRFLGWTLAPTQCTSS
jgi:hypothetical protein